MWRLTIRANDRSPVVRGPPSRLVRAVAALAVFAFVSAAVTVTVVGLLTVTFALLLLLPLVVLLVVVALVAGRGKLQVRMQRRVGADNLRHRDRS